MAAELPADQIQAARDLVRLRDRWESTFARIFKRHWARRQAALLAKTRSVQFRRGTQLWEPAGDAPLSGRLDVLVDMATWDRELAAEVEVALRDLQEEALTHLGYAVVANSRSIAPASTGTLATAASPVMTYLEAAAASLHEPQSYIRAVLAGPDLAQRGDAP